MRMTSGHRRVQLLVLGSLLGLTGSSQAHAEDRSKAAPTEVRSNDPVAFRTIEEVEAELPRYTGPRSIREIDLRPREDIEYTPSPHDWRDAEITLVMPDRIERGEGSIPSGDPRDGRSWHGGNLRGLRARLPYYRAVSNTLWITPVLRTSNFTGYSQHNILDVDPRFGTMEDYRELVREAHRLGMRVITDVVVNHAGNVFSYRGGEFRYDGQAREIETFRDDFFPLELRDPQHFNRRGVAAGTQWEESDAILHADFGDPDNAFPPMRDFNTANRKTQDILLRGLMFLMVELDVDGLRFDASKHIDPSMRQRIARVIPRFARVLGKHNFGLIGEPFSGDRNVLSTFIGKYGEAFPSVFDFGNFFESRPALRGKAPAAQLAHSFHASKAAYGPYAHNVTNFYNNHDFPRLIDERGDPRRVELASAHILFSSGVPQFLYGDEQAMPQMDDGNEVTGDPGNRPDMFAGQYKPKARVGQSSFDVNSAAYRRHRAMVAVRRALSPLRRGEQWVRYAHSEGPGGYVFSRIHEGHEVVVVMNTAEHAIDLPNVWVDASLSAPGTELVDALDEGYSVHSTHAFGGSQIGLRVPPLGVRVLVSRSLYDATREGIVRGLHENDAPTGIEPLVHGSSANRFLRRAQTRAVARVPSLRQPSNELRPIELSEVPALVAEEIGRAPMPVRRAFTPTHSTFRPKTNSMRASRPTLSRAVPTHANRTVRRGALPRSFRR